MPPALLKVGHDPSQILTRHSPTGQKVAVKPTDDHLWLVAFMEYDLGDFDDEACRLEPINNPFGPKLLPMSPE